MKKQFQKTLDRECDQFSTLVSDLEGQFAVLKEIVTAPEREGKLTKIKVSLMGIQDSLVNLSKHTNQ